MRELGKRKQGDSHGVVVDKDNKSTVKYFPSVNDALDYFTNKEKSLKGKNAIIQIIQKKGDSWFTIKKKEVK